MTVPQVFTEQVAMKFRLYAGLFHDLPYEHIRTAGLTLPLFAQYCREGLEAGKRPSVIIEEFCSERLGLKTFAEVRDRLLAYLRLTERQVVLFDAVEDATFHLTRDMEGSGSLTDVLNRVTAAGLEANLGELVEHFGVRIVLTAHPTQFYTEPVLSIISELREAITRNDVLQIHRLLLQLGRTRFKKREQPTPYNEATAIVWFMEHVLYEAFPEVHRRLAQSAVHDPADQARLQPTVELGFWPGGDRDGNPNVTVDTTLKVARLLHDRLIERYCDDLLALSRRLSFDGVIEGLQTARERLLLNFQTGEGQPYPRAEDLLEDLLGIRQTLVTRHDALFVEDLDRFIARVRCFGFHFASLDLRQDSRIVAKTVEAVLTLLAPNEPAYTGLGYPERYALLTKQNEAEVVGKLGSVLATVTDPVVRDTLEVLAAARTVQKRNGQQGLHQFIISNTQGPADLLAVRYLALCAGYAPEALDLDIIPLFETVEDLQSATATMQTLWQNPLYRAHLAHRQNEQHIMLGFSDGTKDGGYLTANWFIYRAKQSLSQAARQAGIRVVFFDGRGGPPARGGGNTHKFYRSMGRDIESRTIHCTIQGQTISSMYGHTDSARYNVEQLLSAVLDNNLFPQNEDWHLDDREAQLIDELSDLARTQYLKLKEHPDFLDYLQELSPLRWYAQTNISSRPSKRPGSSGLKLEDLRAIPFVGAWSQLKLNIPGFFGLGTAFEALDQAGRLEELQALYTDSLYFRTIMENSMQSLSKVYLPLTAWTENDERFGPIRRFIGAEVERTVAYLLRVSGQPALLADDPLNRASIQVREDLTLPISLIQQYAIEQVRRLNGAAGPATAMTPGPNDLETLERFIIKTMATCVNASRNSV